MKKPNFLWVVEFKSDGEWLPEGSAFSRKEARETQEALKSLYHLKTRIVKYFSSNRAE